MNKSNSVKYTVKVVVLCLLMLLIVTAMVMRMAYIQLVVGEELTTNIQSTSTREYDEITSRGEIRDRNGVKLVADVACYKVIFDYYEWEKKGQNEVVLSLCEMLDEKGLKYELNNHKLGKSSAGKAAFCKLILCLFADIKGIYKSFLGKFVLYIPKCCNDIRVGVHDF